MKINHLIPLLSASALIVQSFTADVAKSTIPPSITCTNTFLPVALAPGESKQYQVYGELCSKPGIEKRTVQVLVSGNTYDHSYWDFSYQPEQYSYVKAAVKKGDATFNIDRIGIGKSSRPPADQVTLQSNAYVLNQVNQALRDGTINGVKFERIINVGHSYGSYTVIEAVSEYGNVDGVILTGFIHNTNPVYFNEAAVSFYPVQQDPDPRFQNLPFGYLTSIPGVRGKFFHNLTNTDPQVIALDEATKDTLTLAEAQTATAAFDPEKSKKIKVPVLIVIGQNDLPFCTGNICDNKENVAALEAQFFAPEAQLKTYVLPDAGHSITLAQNAPEWYKVAQKWSNRFVGNSSQ